MNECPIGAGDCPVCRQHHPLKGNPVEVTQEMVDRFLTWKLPTTVRPDGINGDPTRTGTNLLSATEARAMLEHVLGVE